MKLFLSLWLILSLSFSAYSQATNTGYPYPTPLPVSGNTPLTTFRVFSAPGNPFAYQDDFPTVWDVFVGGGYRSAATVAERNAILPGRRKEGMLVYVAADQHLYLLSSNLTTWVDLGLAGTGALGGGGSSATNTIYTADGALTGNRIVTGNFDLTFTGQDDINFAPQDFGVLATTVSINAQGTLNLTTPAVIAGTAEAGQLPMLQNQVTGTIEYAPIYYKANATGAPTFTSSNAALVPDYDPGTVPPEHTVAYVKFDADSLGSDTYTMGPNTTPLPIQRPDGTAIQAGDITANQVVTLIRTGTSSGSAWTLQTVASSAAPSPYPGETPIAVVSTVADAIGLDLTGLETVMTKGYWTLGDGGAGVYHVVNNVTSTNHGSKLASIGTPGYSLELIDNGSVNVLQWGVIRDGATPSGDLINEAFAWGGTQTPHKILYVPPGNYSLTNKILIPYGDVLLKMHGYLRNDAGVSDSVLWIGNTAVVPGITNGIVTYTTGNITIDGGGTGVIDQNCQQSPTQDISDSDHAFLAYGIDRVIVKNLVVTNSTSWAMSIELCNHVEVSGCIVNTGQENNITVGGNPRDFGGQDGIHLQDSSNGHVHHNDVVSGDDSLAASTARTFSGNIIFDNNIATVRLYAYATNGTTLQTNNASGRFPLSVFCAAITVNCTITNVTFDANTMPGGSGLFTVYDEGVGHTGKPTNVKFTGNTWTGQDGQGSTNATSTGVDHGWYISGSDGVEFVGNTFKDIRRWGRISHFVTNSINSVVTFRGNTFKNFGIPYPTDFFGGLVPSILWMDNGVGSGGRLIIENNLFQDNAIIPISVGDTGTLTTNLTESVIVTGNRFINNNTRFSAATPGIDAGTLVVYGCNRVLFNNNTVSTNYGFAVKARSVKKFEARFNTIDGLGTGSFSSSGDAFNLANSSDQSILTTDISNNDVFNIDGRFIEGSNIGETVVRANTVKNAGRSHGTDYAMAISLAGTALSDQPFLQWGGYIDGNYFVRTAASSPLYLNASISSTSYTGNKLRYNITGNFANGGYTNIWVDSNGLGLIDADGVITTTAAATYTVNVGERAIYFTATSTATLPDARLAKGQPFVLKNQSAAGVLSYATVASQTVDGGVGTGTIAARASLTFRSDGANWALE